MFGRIAHSYDLLNHVLSLGIDCYWRRELALSVREGATHRLLDLAAGTLDVSFALRRHHPGFDVLAMDFCQPMLVHGRQKIASTRSRPTPRSFPCPTARWTASP